MSTPYSPQHHWMEWLVDVQVASRGCGSPVCLHTSRLGTAGSKWGERSMGYGFNSTTEIKIKNSLQAASIVWYCQEVPYLLTILLLYCQQSATILLSQNDPSGHIPHCICRRQSSEIYFCELFLAAHFSQQFEKPSEKVPTVHFLLCDSISQPSKI